MASPLSRGGFLETLRKGQLTVGTFLGLASPLAAEVAAVNGVDWVLLDLEHGGGGEPDSGAVHVDEHRPNQWNDFQSSQGVDDRPIGCVDDSAGEQAEHGDGVIVDDSADCSGGG